VFFFHSRSPVGVDKSATDSLRHWGEGCGMIGSRHPKSTLRARAHGVLIGDRWNSHSTLG
jgi:hypothetical protein